MRFNVDTYFPCLYFVKMSSFSSPLARHMRQITWLERFRTGRTIFGHCSSFSGRLSAKKKTLIENFAFICKIRTLFNTSVKLSQFLSNWLHLITIFILSYFVFLFFTYLSLTRHRNTVAICVPCYPEIATDDTKHWSYMECCLWVADTSNHVDTMKRYNWYTAFGIVWAFTCLILTGEKTWTNCDSFLYFEFAYLRMKSRASFTSFQKRISKNENSMSKI